MHAVAKQLNALRTELGAFFKERDEMVYAMLLALVARQHAFALGPPGTGKSDIQGQIMNAIVGARKFKALLSKNRPAEAILGPLDLKLFRETGDYKLKRTGFASQCDFITLDEVGKMSPVLGHDLLNLLNEREYDEVNGGLSTHPAPLMTAFTASNEMITTESDDAAAMWDRLLVRVIVDYIKDRANFAALLTGQRPVFNTTIDFADLKDAVENVVPTIEITDDALMATVILRERLAKEHIYPSDRRFRQSMDVMRASAFLDGRSQVTEDDVAALRFVLWDTVEQVDKVQTMCLTVSNPFYEQLMQIRTDLQEQAIGIEERVGDSEGNRMAHGKSVNTKLKAVRTQLDALMRQSANKAIPGFEAVAELHQSIQLDNFVRMLGQDEDVAEIATKGRLGLGNGDEFWGEK